MKYFKLLTLTALISLTTTSTSLAQASEGNVHLSGYTGVLLANKAKNIDFLAGLEANFFIEDRFAFTVGYDFYSLDNGNSRSNLSSIAMGSRIYPTDYFFLRYKTNLNTKFNSVNDFMLGGGYDIYIADNIFVEPILDYHLIRKGFGIRFALGILL